MIAPTMAQIRVMRILGAGGRIALPTKEGSSYALEVNGVAVQRVMVTTMHELATNGWVAFSVTKQRYELTQHGQDLVDVKTYVRGFVDAQGAH